MSLLLFAAFGCLVGAIACRLYPSQQPMGWIPTIAVGCLGSIIGGLPYGGQPAGWIGSVFGTCVVLWLWRQWSEIDG